MKVHENHTSEPKQLLLIDPPFGSLNGPSIGLPVLATCLRDRGIKVDAMDVSARFYGALLTEENIGTGRDYLETRFEELNRRNRLGFSDMVEYKTVCRLLREKERFEPELGLLTACGLDPDCLRETNHPDLCRFLVQLATIKNFPEIIEFAPRLKKTDLLSKYSSEDLVRAAHQDTFYTKIFKKLLRDVLSGMQPVPLVGISVSFNDQVIPAFQCAALIKKIWPATHITLGGSFVSIHLREIDNPRIFDVVDSLVLDEGEVPLERLCEEVLSGKPSLMSIPNLIACRDGKIEHSRREPPPMDRISFKTDASLFDWDRYPFHRDHVIVPLCLSRGCRWKKCAFCRTEIPVFHHYCPPSPSILYEQLVSLVTRHGAKTVSFSSAFSEPEVLEYISRRLVEDRISLRWVASTRLSNDFTRDLCALFRDAGCMRLSFGIESFSNRILALMKKGIRAEQIEKIITEIDGVIPLFLLMMVGFPTETEQEATDGFQKIREFLDRKVIAGYSYNVFHLTYGSDVWKNPQKYHLSGIRRLPENDLFPNVVRFDCPGMSRETAFRLQERFAENFEEEVPGKVRVLGKYRPLRFDLKGIRNRIKSARSDYLDVCYEKWLLENEHLEGTNANPA